LKQNTFLSCSWTFVRSNTLEQLKLKSEKNNRDLETCRKKKYLLSRSFQVAGPEVTIVEAPKIMEVSEVMEVSEALKVEAGVETKEGAK
jgi:hypothetical protein